MCVYVNEMGVCITISKKGTCNAGMRWGRYSHVYFTMGAYFPFEAIAVKFMAQQMLSGILRTLPWDCTVLMNQGGDPNGERAGKRRRQVHLNLDSPITASPSKPVITGESQFPLGAALLSHCIFTRAAFGLTWCCTAPLHARSGSAAADGSLLPHPQDHCICLASLRVPAWPTRRAEGGLLLPVSPSAKELGKFLGRTGKSQNGLSSSSSGRSHSGTQPGKK